MNGVYIYCNKINGKKYVGQSVNIERRLKDHLRDNQLVVEKAIEKYGIENFYIIKIQYPKEQLNEMEMYYIKFFNSLKNGYNCTIGGEGTSGIKRSESFCLNIRNRMKGKWSGDKNPMYNSKRIGDKNPFYGKKHSKETRKNWSKIRKGMVDSLETKLKKSEKRLGGLNPKAKKYIFIDSENNKFEVFGVFNKFCIDNCLSISSMRNILYGRLKKNNHRGWRVIYQNHKYK